MNGWHSSCLLYPMSILLLFASFYLPKGRNTNDALILIVIASVLSEVILMLSFTMDYQFLPFVKEDQRGLKDSFGRAFRSGVLYLTQYSIGFW